ncbi:phage major capsid protein [Bradyrhizobium sp. KB893862 SZCCT0404]|uniref:phage major capsid protein n=1 Tax=Bradyrhizobium sp. KB893862 SZCCT0404 TaxID=2807672 RepID=UPI001BA56EFB|nr:phage major capsid protein [Bradyrhizobium sp. KB893862 SZCCT0404]MBR1172986.1 phage major capsid protein [Bradyrhizobium sp. KB893862 SZCCT0404]
MGEHLTDLLAEVKAARAVLESGDSERDRAIKQLRSDIDRLSLKINRPGFDDVSDHANRRAAIGLLQLKHALKIPKHDPQHPFAPSEDAITEAKAHIDAIRALMKTTDVARLPDTQRKALSAFSFGASGFVLPPEMSDRILSCTIDQTDVTALMGSATLAGNAIKFLVDKGDLDNAAWGCDASCFANSPNSHDLSSLLGELEIKPEPLRYVACATGDLIEDSAFNLESWLLGKVSRAFRNTVSAAVMIGDGIGKPMGILNPQAGIPICDTGAPTATGQFSWQDLVMLRWQVPVQFQDPASAAYLMNQNTAALLFTMSDANGRPLMVPSLQDPTQFTLMGAPLKIATQMPDPVPGATPVAYGNWKQTYMVATRKAVTMQQDPYSAGFCVLFKFESRIGGAVVCPNAARLLRIK